LDLSAYIVQKPLNLLSEMIFWSGIDHWLKDFRLKDFQPKQ